MQKEQVEDYYREQYETFYAEYDDEYQASNRGLGTDDRDMEEIFLDICEKLHFTSEDIVLDFGCGSGLMSLKILPQVKKISCYDGSQSAIDKLVSNAPWGSAINPHVGNFTDPLPYPDGYFSKVVCYSVFHYLGSVDNFNNIIREILRVTQHGGVILLGDLVVDKMLHENVREFYNQNVLRYSLTLIKMMKLRLAAKIFYNWSINSDTDVSGIYDEERGWKPPSLQSLCKKPIKFGCKCLSIIVLMLTQRHDTMKATKKIKMKTEVLNKIGEIDKFPHFMIDERMLSSIECNHGITCEQVFQRPSLPYATDRLDILIRKK